MARGAAATRHLLATHKGADPVNLAHFTYTPAYIITHSNHIQTHTFLAVKVIITCYFAAELKSLTCLSTEENNWEKRIETNKDELNHFAQLHIYELMRH